MSRYSSDEEDDTASLKDFLEASTRLMDKLSEMIDDEQKKTKKKTSRSNSRSNSPIKKINQINYNFAPFQQNYLAPSQGIAPLGLPIIQPINAIPQPIMSTIPVITPIPSTPLSFQPTQSILVGLIPQSPQIIHNEIPIQPLIIPIQEKINDTQVSYITQPVPIDKADIAQPIDNTQISYIPQPISIDKTNIAQPIDNIQISYITEPIPIDKTNIAQPIDNTQISYIPKPLPFPTINYVDLQNNNYNNKEIIYLQNDYYPKEKEFLELRNQLDENNNKILDLQRENERNRDEIIKLKRQISSGNIYFENQNQFINQGRIIIVSFKSIDGRLNCDIECDENEIFAAIEEKLYEKNPDYRSPNNTFVNQANIISKDRTIRENGIQSGVPVLLIINENNLSGKIDTGSFNIGVGNNYGYNIIQNDLGGNF